MCLSLCTELQFVRHTPRSYTPKHVSIPALNLFMITDIYKHVAEIMAINVKKGKQIKI